jgi:hypothetical protein
MEMIMDKQGRIVLLALLVIIVILTTISCGSSAPASSPTPGIHPGKALVESKCSVCHPITNITGSKKDAGGWEGTVTRMINNGAQLNAEQKTQVIEYLALTYKK